MGRRAITYKRVLEELNKERLWTYGQITESMQDRITLKEFRKVLMFRDITSSERKVREMWKLMEDLDFFYKINQSDARLIRLANVAEALGVEVSKDESLTHAESTETAEGATSE